ncbi:RNA-binding protein [Streptococcus gallolyticus]|nr:RNA-binding protein [Streptococcus gallolyticus]MBY5041744.1 RNA-binding protein [Streptococcus gallolyticus]
MKREDKKLLQHFAQVEEEFVEKIIDLCYQVEETYSYRLTSFCHPKQEEIVRSIAAYFQLQAFSTREMIATEFSRMIIAPTYYELDSKDYDIMALEILYLKKFHSISHSQVLGTLLNQLGMKRQFLVDILIDENQAVVFIDRKFGLMAQSQISKIAKAPIKWQELDWETYSLASPEEGKIREVLLSSLRLDKLVAVTFKLSRATAVKLIEANHVKVDYVETSQVAKALDLGQLISVRGFGRVRLKEMLGFSKQGKYKIAIEVFKK